MSTEDMTTGFCVSKTSESSQANHEPNLASQHRVQSNQSRLYPVPSRQLTATGQNGDTEGDEHHHGDDHEAGAAEPAAAAPRGRRCGGGGTRLAGSTCTDRQMDMLDRSVPQGRRWLGLAKGELIQRWGSNLESSSGLTLVKMSLTVSFSRDPAKQ